VQQTVLQSDLHAYLSNAGIAASSLLSGLIEPGLDVPLPILVEMVMRDRVVGLHRALDTPQDEAITSTPSRGRISQGIDPQIFDANGHDSHVDHSAATTAK